ncbi:putative transmembrane transport protein [Parafrankia sp. EAN1pec]|uniref:transporter n=1 Tax=Parafrankia sp. (strain EAN1pec) TaxID=298653 RepID=UPI00005429B8|nr:putative transmembrane transport protein [Frankia sp. EAN1pec]
MIWMTWRQHRTQALFAVSLLAVLAAVLVPTGLQMHHTFDSLGLPTCLHGPGVAEFVDAAGGGCGPQVEQFTNRFQNRSLIALLLVSLPLFAGLFWGAPMLAREFEHGTHRLVWTQGVSRLRWAVTKFGLVAAGVVAIAAVYTLLVSWWFGPLNQAAGNRFSWMFDVQGLVPVGFSLFAVALGILAGTITRRVLPAMAITLVGFAASRIAVVFLLRPHFLPLVERRYPIVGTTRPNELHGDWVYSAGINNAQGDLIYGGTPTNSVRSYCDPRDVVGTPCHFDVGPGGYNLELIQPVGRYWLFQALETTLFVTLAALVLIAAVHYIRRRAT